MTTPPSPERNYAQIIGWSVAILSGPALGLFGLNRYPLLDSDSPIYYQAFGVGAVGMIPIVLLLRRRIVGEEAPASHLLVPLLGLCFLAGCWGVGVGLVGNGALDNGRRQATTATVAAKYSEERSRIRRRRGGTHYLIVQDGRGAQLRIDVTQDEVARTTVGDTVVVTAAGGFFGHPWLVGYSRK